MAELPAKVTIMKGATPDLSAATYQIHDESHTIGNALRWMLMKNPKVEFCGYRQVHTPLLCPRIFILLPPFAPHPSENVIQVRIQMYDNLSSLSALITALADLDTLCATIEDAYVADVRKGTYERWVEKS
ncbi:RBP11-like subunits of RNA polymerase [Mycena vulgaris]|nr:RBP11-like subunits of RNA polymerase [Mycena vulgaris]